MKPARNNGVVRRVAGWDSRCSRRRVAFTLIEVMIAVTIFFVAMFSILGVLSSGLHAAAILRNNGPTAGMAVALSGLTLTNQTEEGSDSGNFGEVYPDYAWALDKREIATNGLFQVDVTVTHSGQFYSSMSVLLFLKNAGHK